MDCRGSATGTCSKGPVAVANGHPLGLFVKSSWFGHTHDNAIAEWIMGKKGRRSYPREVHHMFSAATNSVVSE